MPTLHWHHVLCAAALFGVSSACGPAPSTPTEDLALCGGIQVIPCDPGFTCLDAPKDRCDPEDGLDCPGLCYACDDPSLRRQYLGTPESCTRLDYECSGGEDSFNDGCGCGCQKANRPPAEAPVEASN